MSNPVPNDAELDDAVANWHAGEGDGLSLAQFLGLSAGDYAAWVERGRPVPNETIPDDQHPGAPETVDFDSRE
jgi:hypothetical protein